MTRTGKNLIFISRIKFDGQGIEPFDSDWLEHVAEQRFRLNCLSVSDGTWIASGMSTYVVKLKEGK